MPILRTATGGVAAAAHDNSCRTAEYNCALTVTAANGAAGGTVGSVTEYNTSPSGVLITPALIEVPPRSTPIDALRAPIFSAMIYFLMP
jgi:hypothetical protein